MSDGEADGGRLIVSVRGRGSVTVGGESVRFATRHAELAVYLLALAAPEGLSRDEFVGALWPDAEPHVARPRLRTALWQVRIALDGHAWRVGRERGVIRLSLEGAGTDVEPGVIVARSDILMGWNFPMPPSILGRVA